MYNDQIAKGKWQEFKGQVQHLWGRITDDELEKTKGNIKQISGLIRQRYGKALNDTEESFDQRFQGLVEKFADNTDAKLASNTKNRN